MKRVFIDFERIKNPYCGLGQFSIALGQHLSLLKHDDLELNYFVPKAQQHYFKNNIQFNTVSPLKKNTLNPGSIFLPSDIDLWHITHQDSDYFPYHKTGNKLLTIHDLNFLFSDDHARIKRRLSKLSKKIDSSHHISTISEFAKNEILKTFGLHSDQISVIYNGVNFNTGPVEKFTGMENRKFLFTIGQVVEKKNFHVLITMMNYLPNLNLIIAGQNETEYAKKITQLIQENGLEERVRLSGPVSDPVKNWLYKNCEAFVFPSLAEGFGLPPIEAMSAGKPVVLSTATSLPEVAGEFGYYWENFEAQSMANQINSAVKDFNLRNRAQNVINHAKGYNWEKAAMNYLSLYQSLLVNHDLKTLISRPDYDFAFSRNK